MLGLLREDIAAIKHRDPAARTTLEVLSYAGLHAVWSHRVAHRLWNTRLPPRELYRVLARWLAAACRALTGVEIHPGARIGRRLVIDHGMGVVIGETAEVGDDVLIYHQVTLGGTSIQRVKRHPTVGNNVLIGMGAKIVGAINVGDNCRIGANAVVNRDVPANCTVVGVPGRVVARDGLRIAPDEPVMDNLINRADPQAELIRELRQRMELMEQHIEKLGQHLADHEAAGMSVDGSAGERGAGATH
ncbi:MAG TPA: serine O-acetyltransferase [Chthonomonadales bacterium]|nr:serine O-acetyltransferase [Chthonomonadales bacterium]